MPFRRYLISEITKADEGTSLCCVSCGQELFRASRLFSLPSAAGRVGAYVNPFGWVHQTVTLSEALPGSMAVLGEPTTDDTWFPPYAWSVALCGACGEHIGWRYVAPDLEAGPTSFWYSMCDAS
jgi:cereblon